jgi:rare lipoprotein A
MKSYVLYIVLLAVLFAGSCSLGRDTGARTRTEPEQDSTAENENKTTSGGTQEIEKEFFQAGEASWYGPDFHGKRTANGEIYDMDKLTAAHKELPFHTLVEVENIDNRKQVIVRINDRGPFIKDRVIDLSKKAAQRLGMVKTGTAPVRLRIIKASDIGKRERRVPVENKPPVLADESSAVSVHPLPVQPQPSARFFLQAGAFSQRENALQMQEHLKDVLPDLDFSVHYDNGLYKVLSKRVSTREQAEQLKQRLSENGFESFIKEE